MTQKTRTQTASRQRPHTQKRLSLVVSLLLFLSTFIHIIAMPGYRRSRALWDEAGRPEASKMALLRAILYELQPIRFSSMDWSRMRANWHASVTAAQKFGTQTLPSTMKRMIAFVRNMSLKSWMMVAGVVLYYFAVRTIHE